MSNALQVPDRDNELLREADDYLRNHKILELFEDLTTIICYKQPENLEAFLVDLLKQRKEQGSRSIVYNEAELQNIFTLYDLKGAGNISKDQCKEALKTLANSEYHFTKVQESHIPEKVDLFTFMKVCDEVLGIKPR